MADWSVKAATHLAILYADGGEFNRKISSDSGDFIRRSRPPAKSQSLLRVHPAIFADRGDQRIKSPGVSPA